MQETLPKRRLYGRKQTRPPGREAQAIMDELLPKLAFTALPRTSASVWLEIGFGNGEHLAAQMRRHPERFFIGAEPFINGMAAFLKNVKDGPHGNIRVWMDDALLLFPLLPDACLDGIYILNPDPWPKKRHHKRRIVRRETLDECARLLRPGGKLIMSTDVDDLADWMTIQAANHTAFAWTAERAADWREPPPDWIETKYQRKGAQAGRRQTYLIFERRA